jgi:hypothetical protein
MSKLDKLFLEQVISEELYEVLSEAGFFDKVKGGAKKLAAAGLMTGALASSPAAAAPTDRAVPQVGQEAPRAYDKSGKETNVDQIKSVTVSKDILEVKDNFVKSQEKMVAQYIRDAESFGGKIKSVTTTFNYVAEINGKTVTVEQVVRKGGEGGDQQILVVNGKKLDAKKYQAGDPNSEQQLADFLSALENYAQMAKK